MPIRCQFVLQEKAKPLICRVSSVVEQRFCKPLVGSSNLSPGTSSQCGTPMQNFSPWQQISIALAVLAAIFYFALQIPWVAALFG